MFSELNNFQKTLSQAMRKSFIAISEKYCTLYAITVIKSTFSKKPDVIMEENES